MCAAWNLKIPEEAEHLSPDDAVRRRARGFGLFCCSELQLIQSQIFEEPVRRLVGVERLMLEAVGFNFRTLHPHSTLFRMMKELNLEPDAAVLISNTALKIVKDVFRTFAGNKQIHTTITIAILELSLRIHELALDDFNSYIYGDDALKTKWATTRAEIMGRSIALQTRPFTQVVAAADSVIQRLLWTFSTSTPTTAWPPVWDPNTPSTLSSSSKSP